ncbi:MAG: PH domain-containing protein [Candidatus Micrarchaeia archaeon]
MERIILKPKRIAFLIRRCFFLLLIAIFVFALSSLYLLSLGGEFVFFIGGAALSLLILFFCLILAQLNYHFTEYELNENTMVARTGIIHHKTETAPLEMITDASLTRDPLDFILDTATVHINTAGEHGYEITLDFLGNGEAYYLKKMLFRLKDEKHMRFERSDMHT